MVIKSFWVNYPFTESKINNIANYCTNRCFHVWLQTFYRCEDGYEEAAARVLEVECRRLLQNLRHEARPQAIRDYYATRGIKKQKKDGRGKFVKKEQYMKVITYS